MVGSKKIIIRSERLFDRKYVENLFKLSMGSFKVLLNIIHPCCEDELWTEKLKVPPESPGGSNRYVSGLMSAFNGFTVSSNGSTPSSNGSTPYTYGS